MGHVTHDLVNGETRLGGAALYSALTSHRMGKRTAVFTSHGDAYAGKGALNGVAASVLPAPETSTFRNLYGEEGRTQFVYRKAADLDLTSLPPAWGASPIVYLCPVLHEVPIDAAVSFPGSTIGVAPQGWMRDWDREGRIRSRRWDGFRDLLRRAQMVIVSEKDIEGNEDLVEAFRPLTPIVIVTRAHEGAILFMGERKLILGAYPARERDPTGAGDCFGMAFLIRYAETGDAREAARFASCVGSLVVEGEGIHGIPSRGAVQERMERCSVACRED